MRSTTRLDGLLAWAVRWLADHQSGFANASNFGDKGFSALILPVRDRRSSSISASGPATSPWTTRVAAVKVTHDVADALREAGLVGKAIGIAGEGALLDRHVREIEERLRDAWTCGPPTRSSSPCTA